MGKVLGIGVLGVVQLVVFVVAALIAAARHRPVRRCPRRRPARSPCSASWFILGYLLYSTALGFLGALASRMEEASNASTPVTMVAMISYFVAIFAVINDPDGHGRDDRHLPPAVGAVRRAAAGRVRCDPAVADRPVGAHHRGRRSGSLFSIGARVYAGAVLQVGGRMKLRDAWRSAGE